MILKAETERLVKFAEKKRKKYSRMMSKSDISASALQAIAASADPTAAQAHRLIFQSRSSH